jgi:hypothetical protein
MKGKSVVLFTLTALLLTTGCRNRGDSVVSRLLTNVTGSSGEVVVVIDKALWDSPDGQRLQKMFEVATPAIPQYEPMFNLLTINRSGFSRLYRNHRNVLFVDIDTSLTASNVVYQTDTYATTQLVFKAAGPNVASVVDEIENKKQLIFDKLLSAERERWMSYFKRTQASHTFNRLRDQHGISLPVPAGFKIDVTKPGFAWISLETPTLTQSVLLHYFKASGSSVFSRDSMMMIRNKLTRTEVPGPVAGSYMGIEERYPVEYRIFSHNGRNYAEIRGLWTLVNGFMGGPFVSIMTYDEKNMRAVFLDGFVYAPNDNKRELIRQVEALLYLADFHSPQEVTVVAKKPEGSNEK